MQLNRIPLFDSLENCNRILLAGAGGGWDILCAIPLLESLTSMGKQVVLANFSFTWLDQTSAECLAPHLYCVRPEDEVKGDRSYFPEKWLVKWLHGRKRDIPVYAFERTGPVKLASAYQWLVREHGLDAIVLVDGGTDILMLGDEADLGTPQEDICSLAAVHSLGMEDCFIVCLGFGVDHYHGVSHYRFLENVSELIRRGGFEGTFQLLHEMPEAKAFIEAVRFVNEAQSGMEGIVANSILSALEGHFGDHHFSARTLGSKLFINALMAQYWCFRLNAVASVNRYIDQILTAENMSEFNQRLKRYRDDIRSVRGHIQLPL